MSRRTAFSASLILAAAASAGSQPAGATVITPPDDQCYSSRDLGGIEVVTDSIPPDGESCAGVPARRLKLRDVSAYWESRDVPVLAIVSRDRAGYRLTMLSMFSDRRQRQACWSEQRIPASGRKSPAATWNWLERAFERWASSCSTTRAVGVETARKSLAARRFDFEEGFKRLAKVPPRRFGEPEEGAEVGSFHPRRMTQGLLDAVADACGGPRERLRLLPDGSIAWSPDHRLPHGADGTLPFDSCVDRQIRYFPGYPKGD